MRAVFFSSRRRHTRCSRDWSSDVCSSDLSTDWPHDDSRFPHAIDGFLTMAPLPQDSKRKVLWRSEEHTSELQSRLHLVCRLLLEKKNDPQNLPFAGLCRSEDKTPELQSSLTHAFRR